MADTSFASLAALLTEAQNAVATLQSQQTSFSQADVDQAKAEQAKVDAASLADLQAQIDAFPKQIADAVAAEDKKEDAKIQAKVKPLADALLEAVKGLVPDVAPEAPPVAADPAQPVTPEDVQAVNTQG